MKSATALSLLLFFLCLSSPILNAETNSSPKLVLQITVDQLRGDLPERYYSRLSKGGFKYLLESGVVYKNTHHNHANTETVVGHATLATGTHPAIHGMVGNNWLDKQQNTIQYIIEDPQSPLIGTERSSAQDGRSPRALLTSTFADELITQSNGSSKAFAVSLKDRGAIPMAGHSGKAFWFSKKQGHFISSQHYYQTLPEWIKKWNKQNPAHRYSQKTWSLLHPQNTYQYSSSDDRPWEAHLPGFDNTFPHSFGTSTNPIFMTLIVTSPSGDELTLDFSKNLIQQEQLGQGNDTDYLSISFSSTDYIGHAFGPNSLEMEDNLLRLDQTLENLFQFIDQRIGLDNTLIVLSADHGSTDSSGYKKQLGIISEPINIRNWEALPEIEKIKQQFAIEGALFERYIDPYLYLSHDVKNNNRINQFQLEKAISNVLQSLPSIAFAISGTAITENRIQPTPLHQKVIHNHHPARSGDLYLIYHPNAFTLNGNGQPASSAHGSPWNPDTFVPLVFAGFNLVHQSVYRRTHTVDIAPTLSAILGLKPPSGSIGNILEDVFQKRNEALHKHQKEAQNKTTH